MKKEDYLFAFPMNIPQTMLDKKGNQSFPDFNDGRQILFFNDGQVDKGFISAEDTALKA